jgi:hypothetical protein
MALRARLDSLVGSRQTVLVERGEQGHTPCFTQVSLEAGSLPGRLLPVRITAREGDHLTGVAA